MMAAEIGSDLGPGPFRTFARVLDAAKKHRAKGVTHLTILIREDVSESDPLQLADFYALGFELVEFIGASEGQKNRSLIEVWRK